MLHIGNVYPSIPIAYTNKTKETRELIEEVLQLISYFEHEWIIVADLKIVAILIGIKGGYPSYPCIFCLYNSRSKVDHYVVKWQLRKNFKIGMYSVIHTPLVNFKKIIMPPLHIKLGVATQYLKTVLKENDNALKAVKQIFPGKTNEKIMAGIFDGPALRKLLKNDEFFESLTPQEATAWLSFKILCEQFFGNHKSPHFRKLVKKMLVDFKKIGVKVSPKLHILAAHLDKFPKNLGDVSDEHGERAHQSMKNMEKRFVKKSNVNALADYFWTLVREKPRKNQKKQQFFHKKNM